MKMENGIGALSCVTVSFVKLKHLDIGHSSV